jgi:hypothetical protein
MARNDNLSSEVSGIAKGRKWNIIMVQMALAEEIAS